MPTVSVILPAYNAAAFIEPTLQSVFNQTFKDYEFIVVDDGSTDATRKVLERYRDRILYIYKENGGQSSARNAGIRIARGDYVALIDHDDIWMENKLELQLAEMAKSDTTGLVTCGAITFDQSGDLKRDISRLNSLTRRQLLRRLLIKNIVGSCSKALLRRECFAKVGLFDESLRMAEDWDMWFRIAQAYDIRSVDSPLVRYRVHERNFSDLDGDVNLRNELRFLDKVFSGGPFKGKGMLKRKVLSERYLSAAIAFREGGETERVRQCVLTAFRYKPTTAFRKIFWGLIYYVFKQAN